MSIGNSFCCLILKINNNSVCGTCDFFKDSLMNKKYKKTAFIKYKITLLFKCLGNYYYNFVEIIIKKYC